MFLSQPKYATYMLVRFHMSDCKSAPTPFQSGVKLVVECTTSLVDATLYHQLVGSLIYLTHSRPYLSFVVNLVSRFVQQPHEIHWQEAKRILRYLQGTLHYGVFYSSSTTVSLSGYTNSNWEGDSFDRQSTAGYVFQLGSGPISWSSKRGKTLSLSSCEAEYRAVKEAVWLRHVLTELGLALKSSTVLKCDN